MPKKEKGQPAGRRVAIIVLNYNNPVATIRCLNSLKLLLEGETDFETIVDDNGSNDNSINQIRLNFPEINLIESPKNLGFAGGNNLAIRQAISAGCTAVLLLNNDTQIIDGQMLDRLLEKEADIAAPLIKFHRDGVSYTDYGGLVDWVKGRNTHLEFPSLQVPKEIGDFDYLTGTCLLIKTEVFKKIGLLDEGYFLYYEDVDFCLRAKKAGFRLARAENTSVYHQLSASANKLGKTKIKILAASHRRFFLHYLSPFVWPVAFAYNLYLSAKAS